METSVQKEKSKKEQGSYRLFCRFIWRHFCLPFYYDQDTQERRTRLGIWRWLDISKINGDLASRSTVDGKGSISLW